MDIIDGISRNVQRALETKCDISSPDIIIDGLWKMDHMKPLFPEKICRLLRSIAAQDHQAVQIQLVVGMLHCLHLVQTILIRNPHQLKRLPGCP